MQTTLRPLAACVALTASLLVVAPPVTIAQGPVFPRTAWEVDDHASDEGHRLRADALTATLRGGDTITAGSRDWEVRHRPGHSPSDLVFVDRTTGTAIAGDHVLSGTSSNPILAAPLEVMVPDETTERLRSLQLFVESMRKTAADDLLLLLPGHGPLVGPPGELIAERLAFHEKRAAKFLEMLDTSEPQTTYTLATRMWKSVVMTQPSLTHSEVIGHLDLLEADGRVAEVVIGDGVVGFIAT